MTNNYTPLQEEDNSSFVSDSQHNWGGPWTEEKLDAFEKYVNAYLTIMNKYRDKFNWKLLFLMALLVAEQEIPTMNLTLN